MFSGVIEETGRFIDHQSNQIRISTSPRLISQLKIGDSICVSGACLTVVNLTDDWFEADLAEETIKRTNFGLLSPGDKLNLEPSLKLSDRLHGHTVQGHVDGIGEVTAPVPNLGVRLPQDLLKYAVEKGSITIEGVSLTIASVQDSQISIAVIPHSSRVTNLGELAVGDKVNVEVDIIGKYVERMVLHHLEQFRQS